MDQYFDLIEKYNEANPTMDDGTENIRTRSSAMTGDTSVWKMHHSFGWLSK